MSACSIRTVGASHARAHGKKSARAVLLAGKFVLIGLGHAILANDPSLIRGAIPTSFGTA
jgi:hypothetical protein